MSLTHPDQGAPLHPNARWVAGTFAREAGAEVRLAANDAESWLGIEEISTEQQVAEAEGDELRIIPFVGDEDAVMARPYARSLRPGWRDGTRELVVSLPAVREEHFAELTSILWAALAYWQAIAIPPPAETGQGGSTPKGPREGELSLATDSVSIDPPVSVIEHSLDEGGTAQEPDDDAEIEAPVRMRADISEQWSWASSAAKIPQISNLVVEVTEPLAHAEIRVTVRDGSTEFGSALAFSDALPAGTRTMPGLHVPLSPSVMARVEERHSAHCLIELSSEGRALARLDESIDVMPRDLWFWRGDPRRPEQEARLRRRLEELTHLLDQKPSDAEVLEAERTEVARQLTASLTGSRSLARALLASFVRPNHPEIAVVAREAAELLHRATGDGSFAAFQTADPGVAEHRADAIVDGIYHALRARSISYSEPPPSWDFRTAGQRIRDHGVVAKRGLGTCMDTTVLVAAVIEQVGLHPVLVLVPGHIFVGYWRRDPLPEGRPQPDWYPNRPVFDNEAAVAGLVAGGFLGVIETTTLADSSRTAAQARTMARSALEQGPSSHPPGEWFIEAIDVACARTAGVSPLPAIHDRPDGIVEVIEYRPGGAQAVTRVDTTPLQASGERNVDDHPARYRTWKSSLFSLSATNELLNLKMNARVQPLLVPPTMLGRLEDSLNRNSAFTLTSGWDIPSVWQARDFRNALQLFDSGNPDDMQELVEHLDRRHVFVQRIGRVKGQLGPMSPAAFFRELRSMAHNAKISRDERGMNPLYLCLGSLRWPYKEGVWAEAPLILVPVTLTAARGRPEFTITLDASPQTTPNAALIEWLRRMHGLDIPGLAEPLTDGAGIDVDGVLADVRRAVSASGLPFDIRADARLAILDLAAFRMWQDLNANAGTFLARPLIRHLVHSPTETFVDAAAIDESDPKNLADELERLETPISADSTQKRAVLWARQGRTFVLQGPPGTGKSQTITNMVAECLLSGMKVLFVAEKGTALSVVQRRLDDIGLGPYMLNLHHEGSTPTIVREQLRRSLAAAAHPDRLAMENARRKLRTMRYELGAYPAHLHARNAAGQSAYTAHDELLVLGQGPALPVPESLVAHESERVEELRTVFQDLQRWTTAADVRPNHPWRFAGPGTADPFDVEAVSAAVRGVIAGAEWAVLIGGELAAALSEVTHPRQLSVLAAATHASLPRDGLRDVLTPEWPARARLTIDQCAREAAPYDDTLKHFHPDVMGFELRAMLDELHAAQQTGFFGRKARVAAAIAPLLQVAPPGAVLPDNAESVLTALIDIQTAMARFRERLASIPGMADHVPTNPLLPGALELPKRRIDEVDAATAPLRGHGAWTERALELREGGHLTGHEEPLRKYAAAWGTLLEHLAVSDHDFDVWRAGATLHDSTRRHLDHWRREVDHERLVDLQRWCALVRQLEAVRASGLTATRDELLDGTIPGYQAEEALARGLSQASLRERMRAEGLDRFDSLAHEARVTAYIGAQSDVRRQWVSDGPARLLLARGAGGLGSHTGGLARELEKTSRRLGTRAILRKYGQAVQQLTPLVLASPSSVVDLIEPGVMEFDLVIFDEASQITVPEAVGSLGRAKAAIVVGDTKQMPPTRKVGGNSGADEDIDDPDALEVVEDQESILSECELARVPTLSLTWHYRSQDEALIAFSNRTYYRGGLSSFPTPTLLSDATGVEFRRVEGRYLRAGSTPEQLGGGVTAGSNTNPIEARAIVDAVHAVVNAEAVLPSIGIVTFNEPQRQLIADLLGASEDPRVAELMDESRVGRANALFVKALEQVQGDERDTIIFSIAFSKQANGRIPTNFGPLSNSGGERRLNVAITRARRKNIVYCSFDPAELDVSGATFSGPKDLKEFLAYAKASGTVDHVVDPGTRPSLRDRHRDDVAEVLRNAGLYVMSDVGLSNFRIDLVIARPQQPDRPILPILLDGESWRQRSTVSDRDVLPVEVLHGLMGWPSVARIWWPMWLQNRDEVVQTILAEVARAEATLTEATAPAEDGSDEDAPPPPQPAVAPRSELDESVAGAWRTVRESLPATGVDAHPVVGGPVDEPDREGHPEPTHEQVPDATPELGPDSEVEGAEDPFLAAHTNVVAPKEVLDALPDRWAKTAVREQLDDVIATEGPIELARLTRIVARRFGLNAVRAARAEAITALIPRKQVRRGKLGVFVWPHDLDPDAWEGFRYALDDPLRTLDEVAPEEIANAMRAVMSEYPRFHSEDVLRTTADVFGIVRLGAKVRERLEAVQRMIDN